MAYPVRIEPDTQFIRELQAAGGDSLKKCYQCATCSVACAISPASNPYPRKEMIWAQWGLKDRLLSDPDVWLCYNCGACSDLCPRGARPADLMSALRTMAYQTLFRPAGLNIGKWMSSARYLPILIGIPAVIFAVIWLFMATVNLHGNFADGGIFPSGPIVFGKVFYGDYTIDPLFIAVMLFVLFSFYRGVTALIRGIGPKGPTMVLGGSKPWWQCLAQAVVDEILPHSRFAECGAEPEKVNRKIGHMALMFGFIALAVVTGCIAFGHWGGRLPGLHFLYLDTPLPWFHPLKLLAYAGMILLLAGLTIITLRRRSLDAAKQRSGYHDWYLLGVIWAVTLTGACAMIFRTLGLCAPAYLTYYLHLVSVFMLFAYLPWSKLGHLVYRTAAITYVRYMGR
jgi:quinone-modifying oxidoreductase subunit QmoC